MQYSILYLNILNFVYCLAYNNVPPTSGFYTDGLDKANDKVEIVYPEKISKDGSFVSYYLPHYYNMDHLENRPRRTSGYPKLSNKDEIHFSVPIDGENHHLELWPNMDFIAPGLVVERRDARDVENINKAKISQISQRQCHYSGKIAGKPNSSAALSTCYGLAGYIRVPAGDEYIIEPVKDSKPLHDKEHPHVIYKRSNLKDRHSGTNCLTKGRAKDALDERLQWEALFGDQVRKELSGININELVLDSQVKSSHTPVRDKLPTDNTFDGNLPFVGKSILNSDNLQSDDKSRYVNRHKMKNNFGSNSQDELQYENLNLPQIDGPIKNEQHYFGNKLNLKSLKAETSMGNIKLPDANIESLKPIPDRMAERNSVGDGYSNSKYSADKQVNKGAIDLRRFKRDLNEEKTALSPDANKSTEITKSNITEANNTKAPLKSEQNFTSNKNDSNEKSIQHDIASVNVNVTKNGLTSNQTMKSKKEITNSNFSNNDLLDNNPHRYAKLKPCSEKYQSNSKVIKRSNDDLTKQPEGRNSPHSHRIDANEDDGTVNENQNSCAEKKKRNSMNSMFNNISRNNEDSGHNDNFIQKVENHIKREIHLDASEKSWQSNDSNYSPTISRSQLYYKNLHSEENSDKRPNKNDDFHKTIQHNYENKEVKGFEPSKIIKVSENNLGPEEKIMTSVLESVIKDMNKSKVKKETNQEFISDRSTNYQHNKPVNSKPSLIQDRDKYVKFDKVCLTNLENSKVKDESLNLADNHQQLAFIGKDDDDDVVNVSNEQEPQVLMQSLSAIPNQNHVDEIVIRIKPLEGPVSDVKQCPESETDDSKRENILQSNLPQQKDSRFQIKKNLELDQTNLRKVSKDQKKRDALIKNDLSSSKKTNDKEIKKKDDYIGNTHLHDNSETSENSKSKVKRDDTIHLIIETEPEVNNPDISNYNLQRSGLFCQGKQCLDIRPVILNDTNIVAVSPSNNTNADNLKSKMLEKREVPPGDCSAEPTTESPLVCFDFFSKLFNLELMITVDYKVVKLHEDGDIENFILTIINMVSTNFYDKTLGINLSVFLVRLILLTTCIKELDSDRFTPQELLENFCTWQVLINPGKDDHPHHHDLAIFITRMDKCEGQVMGVTYMTSVCRPDKACLVCVDEGLLLANTITHQIGHSLGAEHDDGQSSGCASVASDGTGHHMGPTITETSSAWSTCSRDAIIQFVRTQGSWCLSDLPAQRSFNFPMMLPGQIYTAAQQCKLNFHMTAFPCAVGAFCEKLYCQVTEKLCATKGDPPADGTFCASNMWCFRKQCVHIGRRPGAINGEWGPWTEWSICTRSCGGGVSSGYRICNNPKPSNGGRYCVGDRIRHKMCATKPCQGFTESFRDLQCKRTEDRPFRGRLHNWVQYQSFFLNIECALVCQNRKGDVVMRSPIVADGTPCKAGTRNVCIQGVCRGVGCDWVIESTAKEDACGVCHGNGTECKIIQGVFDEATNTKGLVEFLRIPKGSGMIFVREVAPSANILVVSGSINRVFYLNGQGNEDAMPGDVSFGLTHGVYEVRSAMERIFIRGPTTEELIFYVLFREPNKGIHYQYAVPEADNSYIPRYLWQYLDWDLCSDPCSGGSQRSQPKCVEDRGGVVDNQYCEASSKPMDIIRPCNEFPCQAKWWLSVWSDCICTGSSSVKFRSVLCMRATDESGTRSEIVKESECTDKKPPTQKPCNATEDDIECVKRSVATDAMFSAHKDIRRAVSPKTAYAALSPVGLTDIGNQEGELLRDHATSDRDDRETQNANKNQKKTVKTQNVKNLNIQGVANKQKPKQTEKDPQWEKKKINSPKSKEIGHPEPAIVTKSKGSEGGKPFRKPEDFPLASEKGKQIAKYSSKSGDVSSIGNVKHSDKTKQADESDVDINSRDSKSDKCDTTTDSPNSENCFAAEMDTTDKASTNCKSTSIVEPHKRTTCCKTTPRRRIMNANVLMESTTLRPISVKLDELNMHNFALTVIPLDYPPKKMLPLSDPEFINLGNIGQFNVADESNGTVITGQEALDFLEFARSNASEEPVILHEDMH